MAHNMGQTSRMLLRVVAVLLASLLLVLLQSPVTHSVTVEIASTWNISFDPAVGSGNTNTSVFILDDYSLFDSPLRISTPVWNGTTGWAYADEIQFKGTLPKNIYIGNSARTGRQWGGPNVQFSSNSSQFITVTGCMGIFSEAYVLAQRNAGSGSAATMPPCVTDIVDVSAVPTTLAASFQLSLGSPNGGAVGNTITLQSQAITILSASLPASKKLYFVVVLYPGSTSQQGVMTEISKYTFGSNVQPPMPPSPPKPPLGATNLRAAVGLMVPLIILALLLV